MTFLRSLLRFGGVSAVCFLLHNLIMVAADATGLNYVVATLMSYAVVGVVGYRLHSAYSFRTTRNRSGFARYALAMAGNLPAQWLLLWLLIGRLGLPMLMAAPLSTLAMMAYNFLISRWALLRTHRDPAIGQGTEEPLDVPARASRV